MAYVLPLALTSSHARPASDQALGRSSPSVASISSSCTVQHNRPRNISTSSLSSTSSYFLSSLPGHSELAATRSASSINFSSRQPCHVGTPRRSSLTSTVSEHFRSDTVIDSPVNEQKLADVAEDINESSEQSDEAGKQHDICLGNETISTLDLPPIRQTIERRSLEPSIRSTEPRAFQRWVSKLKKRKQSKPVVLTPRQDRFVLDDFDKFSITSPMQKPSNHRKSDSQNSSLRFVTAIRSATATLASASVATVSRRTSKWKPGHQRSSVLSSPDGRPSGESHRSIVDEAAKQRSRKRREKLEELIRTEESYVADVKALSNAYFTLLGHRPTSASFARPSAQRMIAEILHLHDDLLGHLHRVVPFAEYDQCLAKTQQPPVALRAHGRWHSVDVVPQIRRTTPVKSALAAVRHGRRSLNISRSSDDDPMVLRCSPDVVAEVARVFASHLNRFSVYEEYGANYELIQRDIDETQRSIAAWPDFDKAIELLAAHINPTRSWEANRKKALTVKDLLIKPIQRLPRYELLFNDLVKLTPVCDDPVSYAVTDGLRAQLNETCQRMNAAKDNPVQNRILETTWMIGDRLTFSGQVPRSVFLQLLGQVTLCGCLHLAYRGKDRIKGCYAVCILFETTLLLASVDEEQSKYSILAGVALAHATIAETDNLKGLQCHTAPHSWKVIFEHGARMFEVILTACSAIEADVWRTCIGDGIEKQTHAVAEGAANVFELQSPLTAEMRSIGKAFGKPGSFVRRMSVHRTATVGPTTDLNQVIIKNTQAVKEVQDNGSQTSLQIPRSQSVATPSHVQTLAPRRADRHRLETVLSDVWTKDLLPYPRMVRRSDPLRASANHVLRKFSMASMTSNFSSSKRTASYTSIASFRKEDVAPPRAKNSFGDSLSRSSKPAKPPVVNFHTAPDAFLPADFELDGPNAKRKKLGLRTLTMTMERPFSPLLSMENKASSLRRAKSVRHATRSPATPMPPDVARSGNEADGRMDTSIYSIGNERAKTPAGLRTREEAAVSEGAGSKTPRKSKSKSRLMRLFG